MASPLMTVGVFICLASQIGCSTALTVRGKQRGYDVRESLLATCANPHRGLALTRRF
jgi:hypothetical protein